MINSEKVKYMFSFLGNSGLKPIKGGRGKFILYSPVDYVVVVERQQYAGPASAQSEE